MAVAYSFAEICSAFPVAGGQYSWVAILAPKTYARPLSFCCGWFILIGISQISLNLLLRFNIAMYYENP
jgi:choline transport protein